MRREPGDAFVAAELDGATATSTGGAPLPAHFVPTGHPVDSPGEPARAPPDQVPDPFRSRLPGDAATGPAASPDRRLIPHSTGGAAGAMISFSSGGRTGVT
ncbi:hypothetical protein ACFXA3_00645 [Streptomyces sp. NPDC059456]|uniref:hypothetical protein n=1 Tax=Streptomyces sp. NPDC059456 TaxID=3346838 RepID=UPI00367BE7F9